VLDVEVVTQEGSDVKLYEGSRDPASAISHYLGKIKQEGTHS